MSTRAECREQMESLFRRLAPIVAEFPADQPAPISREQLDRIALAVNVFPGLRAHRGLLERLGIEIPMGEAVRPASR